MKADVVKNLQLTSDEVEVIISLYYTFIDELEEEDCNWNDLMWDIVHKNPKSNNIIITYLDEKAE